MKKLKKGKIFKVLYNKMTPKAHLPQDMERKIDPKTRRRKRYLQVKSIFYRMFPFFTNKPTTATIHLNNICNSRCITCFIWKNRNEPQLSYEDVRAFIDDVVESFGKMTITFTGGEPMLHPRILDMISYVEEKKCRSRILTNGLLLTPFTLDKLYASKLSCLTISLNSMDEKTHDESRGVIGNHRRILEAVQYVRDTYPSIDIEFTMILYERNSDHMLALAQYAKEIGALLQIQPLRYLFQSKKHFSIKESDRAFQNLIPKDHGKIISRLQEHARMPFNGAGLLLPRSYVKKYTQYLKNLDQPTQQKVSQKILILKNNGDLKFNDQLPAIGNIKDEMASKLISSSKAKEQLANLRIKQVCLCDLSPTMKDLAYMGIAALFRSRSE